MEVLTVVLYVVRLLVSYLYFSVAFGLSIKYDYFLLNAFRKKLARMATLCFLLSSNNANFQSQRN